MHAFLRWEPDCSVGPGGRRDLANGAEPASLPPAHSSAAATAIPTGLAQCPALQRLLAGVQSNHTKEPELHLSREESCRGSARPRPASKAGRLYVRGLPTVVW